MDFDLRQLKAIETTGSDILVSAPAGSGKTTVMIERIVRLIERGTSLKRILVVTFTKAAAADMKAKLFRALCDRKKKIGRRALSELATADISTLHSFCGKIARTYFYAIDLDPAFELLDDGDSSLLTRCLDEVTQEAALEYASELYEIMLSSRKDKPFRAAVLKVYEAAVASPDPKGWLDGCLKYCEDDTEAKAAVLTDLDRERRLILGKAKECLSATECAGFARNIAAASELCDALERDDFSLMVSSPKGKVPTEFFDLNEQLKSVKDRAKKYFERKSEAAELIDSKRAYPYAAALRDAARRLLELYDAEKKRAALADYSDLEHYAYDILLTETGESIRQSYDYVFVDEYQDINPLQDAIISLVKRKNNLFMVGDLKQSIYAFRGCEPTIFSGKKEAFERGEGTNVELNANFRTCPEIVENVNRIFSACMTPSFGGVDYRKASLKPTRTDKGAFRYVDLTVSDGEDGDEEDGFDEVYRLSRHEGEKITQTDVESEFVVREILKLLDGNLSPSDIAVLTRTRRELSYAIRDKLAAAGVPVFVKEAADVSSKPETAPLIAMLRLTENRADDIALATALTAYTGRLTSDELAEIAASAKEGEPFYAAAYRHPRLAEFVGRLDGYTVLSQSVSAAELLSKIAEDCDAYIMADKMSIGGEKTAAVSELILSGEGMTATQFLERLDSGEGKEIAAPEGSLKIMTVHMSKGLEFEHVFLAGIKRGFNRSDFAVPYLIDGKWKLAMKVPDPDKHEFRDTFLTKAATLSLKKRALEEEMRIMYVALTRAKKTLTVSGCNIGRRETENLELDPPLSPADFFYALTPETVDMSDDMSETVPTDRKTVIEAKETEFAKRVQKLIGFSLPTATGAAKTTVTAIAHALPEEFDGYFTGESYALDPEEAAFRGTAFHLFMQKLDFGADFRLQRVAFETEYPEEARLVDFDKARTAAEAVARLVSGRKLYREKEFVLDREGTLLQGVIDLLAVGDDGVIIVDYKTGANVMKASYRAQLELYGEAASKILGKRIDGLYLCALEKGEIYPLDSLPNKKQ